MKLVETPIRSVWPMVRMGLEALAAKVPVAWLPEDVYAECAAGNAWLYLPTDGVTGFIVFKPQRRNYSGERELLVWIVWGQGQNLLERYNADVEALARVHGFDCLTFWSPRPGLERVPERLPGWAKQTVVYERRLT